MSKKKKRAFIPLFLYLLGKNIKYTSSERRHETKGCGRGQLD